VLCGARSVKISYDGDMATAIRFMQMAQQEWWVLRPVSGRGRNAHSFRMLWGEATAYFTYGDGMDGIHISARTIEGAGQMFSFLSGAVIGQGQIAGTGLFAYAPTTNSIEKFSYQSHPLITTRLKIPAHATMPSRIEGGEADSQYTLQVASKYTGRMAQVVQLILGYGKLRKDAVISLAIKKFRDSLGHPIVTPPSVIWVPENIKKGVENTFDWRWARTHGIFTRTYVEEGVTKRAHWIIEVSTASGVRAMPLQIEPVTALPEFRAYVLAEIAKSGHKKYFDDVKLVLDTFGGFPSNQAFVSTVPAIAAQRVTLLSVEAMPKYVDGTAVSSDHGWAFNNDGSRCNTVCLETFADNSWQMAHHCQITFSWDAGTSRPQATFTVIESGAAPTAKHVLKVGDTALDGCVSYNLGLKVTGADYSGRPKATRTAMFVFWRNDRLEALRWADSRIDSDTPRTSESSDEYHSLTETWTGVVGKAQGFFCVMYDGRINTEDNHTKREWTKHIEGEAYRFIATNPASDTPEWFARQFWAWNETREQEWIGGHTIDCCAFVPLGDRSAFYLATMNRRPDYHDKRNTSIYRVGDPYYYALHDTYVWNWDFGRQYGKPYPVTDHGATQDGVFDVVWDRNGSRGKVQAEIYGHPFLWGPHVYKGGSSYFALTPAEQATLDAWTEHTGHAEWADIGSQPSYAQPSYPFSGNVGETYDRYTNGQTTLNVTLVSMQRVGTVFLRAGSYTDIYRDYNYWFDVSPNENGDYQTMWAFKNYFGGKFYQLYSTDVNDRNLETMGGYELDPSDFPTFIGVVGDIPA